MITTRELLELAQLDALGLLDTEERDSFDAAFDAAPPAIQGQVRAEQARLSVMERTLPDVTPPASLRENVLAAVRGAIAAMAREASPLRLVGRGHALASAHHVAPAWRAAAIGLAAAAVVFGTSTVWMFGMYSSLSTQLSNDQRIEAMKDATSAQYISDFLFDKDTQRRYFSPEGGFGGSATILAHSRWKTARLTGEGFNLAEGETLRLVTLNDAGNAVSREWATIESRGPLFGVDVPTEAFTESRLALVKFDAEGKMDVVLMRIDLA